MAVVLNIIEGSRYASSERPVNEVSGASGNETLILSATYEPSKWSLRTPRARRLFLDAKAMHAASEVEHLRRPPMRRTLVTPV